jgi:hypothetical protein
MRHKLALVLANTGLLAVVLVLLAGPLLLGQLLGSSQSGALGATQAAPAGRSMTVYPNTTDFSQYATFNPSPLVEPLFYQTSVTFTAFAGQQAAYNGLLTVYNPSTSPLTIRAEVGRLSGDLMTSSVWMTLSPEGQSTISLLTAQAEVGARELQVADASGFTSGEMVINDVHMQATKKSATQLSLSTPLSKAVAVGDKVYLGAAFYAKDFTPAVNTTQSIRLAPGSRATISLTVATEGGKGQQQAVIPVTITAE